VGLGIAASGALISGPFLAAAKSFADRGEEIAKLSKITGLAAEELSRMGYAADQVDVSLESIAGGMGIFEKGLFNIQNGSKESQNFANALKALGLNMEALKGKTPEAQLQLISDKFQTLKTATDREGVAMDLFGRSGKELIPVLDLGSAGLASMAQKADALGITMSGADADAAEQFSQSMKDVHAAVQGLENAIGSALAPTLTALAKDLAEGTAGLGRFAGAHRDAIIAITALGGVLTVAGSTLASIGFAAMGAAQGIQTFIKAFNLCRWAAGELGAVTTAVRNLSAMTVEFLALNPEILLLVGVAAALAGTYALITQKADEAAAANRRLSESIIAVNAAGEMSLKAQDQQRKLGQEYLAATEALKNAQFLLSQAKSPSERAHALAEQADALERLRDVQEQQIILDKKLADSDPNMKSADPAIRAAFQAQHQMDIDGDIKGLDDINAQLDRTQKELEGLATEGITPAAGTPPTPLTPPPPTPTPPPTPAPLPIPPPAPPAGAADDHKTHLEEMKKLHEHLIAEWKKATAEVARLLKEAPAAVGRFVAGLAAGPAAGSGPGAGLPEVKEFTAVGLNDARQLAALIASGNAPKEKGEKHVAAIKETTAEVKGLRGDFQKLAPLLALAGTLV
jgi:hypothetical protein